MEGMTVDDPPAPPARPVAVVLLAHPRRDSLNHAIAATIVETLRQQQIDVRFHDLYAEGFDPVLRPEEAYTIGQSVEEVVAATTDPVLRTHRAELGQASQLVVVHPNWWGKPPAILAGWMDRVLVPGVAYRLDDAANVPIPLVRLQRLLIINTSDTTEERETELFGDPLEAIWTRCLPAYLGQPEVRRLVLRVVAEADEAQRRQWLDEIADLAAAEADDVTRSVHLRDAVEEGRSQLAAGGIDDDADGDLDAVGGQGGTRAPGTTPRGSPGSGGSNRTTAPTPEDCSDGHGQTGGHQPRTPDHDVSITALLVQVGDSHRDRHSIVANGVPDLEGCDITCGPGSGTPSQ